MKLRMVLVLVLCFSFGMTVNVFAGNQGGGKRLVLNLIGTGSMYEGTVADIDGEGDDLDAICFDVDVVNVKNGQVIGSGTDCLSNITSVGVEGGLALVGTTFFHLRQGTLIVRGATTVQPVTHDPTMTSSGHLVTHITGAASPENSILEGTKRFSDKTGTTRLSGMVDMSNFDGEVGSPIFFDCVFVIDLD